MREYNGDQILPQDWDVNTDPDGNNLETTHKLRGKKYNCRQYTQGVDWRQFTEVECGVSAEEFWDCHNRDEWEQLEKDRFENYFNYTYK